ncbi:Glyoxalase/bleomycin resistance protein/dioxygenase [Thermobaculum terrenum ATCC BAA-798]|uniref:Glyoxalase/bleomycin resistance protein/dioxygenase n=1 Tax=Thermobaculum terrenum (strain ATCC BAA-798 / CCMEE 7001 / YNP1) TaxID=525904 RepID=D1CF79_THET1|nr:VOC family protein [Thermobaculum terrenum]ACZ41585.1 Glyoxalase/bleomycin resistance protein/dioxygenase [Thermobaculum terrenum ATCC BAA-798]
MSDYIVPPATKIGHVHLKVSDLERSLWFYQEVLGFEVIAKMGSSAAFLSAGGYHHHIAINTWESLGGSPPPLGSTGLYHFAINYPTRKDLATIFDRLLQYNWPIDGASDHGTHEAIYTHDPDMNGIELAWDRDRSEWPTTNGKIHFYTRPLNVDSLLSEIQK